MKIYIAIEKKRTLNTAITVTYKNKFSLNMLWGLNCLLKYNVGVNKKQVIQLIHD